ncbi:MAG: HIRAN domain-containing protein [Eubacteriales bacterium]|nr:HIRAN domain-containing protein [Eubacteriales bacterium]
MSNDITVKKSDLAKAIGNGSVTDMLKPLVREIHLFDTFIAGTSYLEDKSVLAGVRVDDKVALKREDNKFDDKAILVLNEEGKKLGYIPEKDNEIFARLMDAGKLLSGKVNGIEKQGSFTKIGIGIYLVDY